MSLVDSLIESYAAPEDSFAVVLPKGEAFTFRAVRSYSEINALKEQAAKFLRYCRSDKAKPFAVPEDDLTVTSAFVLSETSLEPKLTQVDCLTLAAKAGYLFNDMVDKWNAAQSGPKEAAEADEVERLKNDSTPTPSED